MEKINWRHIGIFVFITVLAFLLDRFAKEFLMRTLESRMEVIPGIFALTVQQNLGVAFSIKIPYLVQILLTPVLIIVGIKFSFDYLDIARKFVIIVLGFVVGGALGNFADRVVYGGVIDYLSFWRYPVFNLADIFIVVGIFILVAFYGKIKRV